MKILLVVATKLEIIEEKFKNCDVIITGAGMVNTTFSLTKRLSKRSYDLVINMGVAGSFSDKIKIGDVVEVVEDIFSEIGYEDGNRFLEFTNFRIENSFKVDEKTNLNKAKGITVNTVHGNEKTITEIVRKLNPDVESMEGAACFMVCKQFEIPCIQIRAISNKVEKRNTENWDLDLAISNLNTEVEKTIDYL
ncbi:MAG TPA: futalosine hydrolase [Flavobacteriales bacterium]|nr:futalosine hydrolase [Flavobacteriales bacterium]HIK62689.1 futalosine hydrolase [Flavobacteriales bacterium]